MFTNILDVTDAIGQTFRLVDQLTLPGTTYFVLGRQEILVDLHVGGTWTLQIESPGGIWIDTDITFVDVGVKALWVTQSARYRLTGGVPGARAYVTGAWNVGV